MLRTLDSNWLLELLLIALLSGSLDQLETESHQETAYRTELENYVTSNNILSGSKWVQLSSFNDTELEQLVKAHMQSGMAGVYGILADKQNEIFAPSLKVLEPIINPKPPICKIVECN